MSTSRDRTQVLIQAARAYYEEGRTQEEIAEMLHVSRSQISHYLREASDLGIVQIRIVDPATRVTELEKRLLKNFPHLKEVCVVPLFSQEEAITRKVVGRAAAALLEEVVHPGDHVCIGSGRTLREMVRVLRPTPQKNIALVQAMGSIGHEALEIDFAEVVREAGKAFGARVYIISAPAILGAGSAAGLIESNPSIAQAMQLAKNADIFIVGIGSLESDLIYSRAGLVSDSEFENLQMIQVVGDICGRFFDIRGQPLRSRFEDRVVGIQLEDLKRARLSIGVAGGPEKIPSLLGALRGGYINAIVTDEQTTIGLLQVDAETR